MKDRVQRRTATRRWRQTLIEPSAVAGEEQDRDQEDLHGDEEAPARNVRNPKRPLPEERELHNKRGYLPYKAWCPVCVKATGREDQHEAKESDEHAVVKVPMDYCSAGEMKLLVGREQACICHLCKFGGWSNRGQDNEEHQRHGEHEDCIED